MKINEEKLAKYQVYRFLVLMFTNSCWLKTNGRWVKHTLEEPKVSKWRPKRGYSGKSWWYDEY